MSANELSAVLWHERELLETLLFKLDTQQLLLATGRVRWLPLATRELEQIAERLQRSGVARAVDSSGLAAEWGIDEQAGLRELATAAPTEAWREVFESHLTALTRLTDEIVALRDENARMLRSASQSTQETLAGLGTTSPTYTAAGTAEAATPDARLIDTAI